MLVINVSKIPPEGLSIDAPLLAGEVHLEGEDSFTLTGGSLRVRVERAEGGTVHGGGRRAGEGGLRCSRCLEPFVLPIDQELDLFYLAHEKGQDEEEDEVELSDRDVVVASYRGDRLDLGDVIREQLFLAVPLARACREDCKGLCPRCGANRNQQECGCPPPEASESPFSSL